MELVTFHDRIYGKYDGKLFTFESTWDSFRPITGVGWNGKRMIPIDTEYKSNLFDAFYGYGSLEIKALCRKLTSETELETAKEIRDPIQLWRWYGEINLKWWKDRPCVFVSPCVERDMSGWKTYLTYLDVRAKTLRRPFKGRLTRRLLPK
jgi:hypothetical protein